MNFQILFLSLFLLVSSTTAIELNQTSLFESFGYSFESKSINLELQGIQKIDPNTFNGLTKLEVINLNNNELTSLNALIFKGLFNLRKVYIESNKLISIDKNVFIGLNNLELICLHKNPIVSLYPTIAGSLCETNLKCEIFTNETCEVNQSSIEFLTSSTSFNATTTTTTTTTTTSTRPTTTSPRPTTTTTSVPATTKLQQIADSTILTVLQTNLIDIFLNSPKKIKWNLLYRASRDGFGAADFHSKCDIQSTFLVIIKTNESFIFGAYTETDWSSGGFKTDNSAFIFSLENKDGQPLKINCIQPEYAVYSNPFSSYGPTFGRGHDIYISDNSNSSSASFSNLGDSFKHPNYAFGTTQAKSFLAGSYNFQTADIEVYYKDRNLFHLLNALIINFLNINLF